MQYQLNAKLSEKAFVSVEDRAFLYGDGCFTTARIRHGRLILFTRHLHRLAQACQQLRLDCSVDRIKNDIEQFLSHLAPDAQGVLKVVISRGQGKRGYAVTALAADIHVYFYPDEDGLPQQPAFIEQVGVIPDAVGTTLPQLKGIKTLNRLEQVWLKSYATEQNWQEAFCVDIHQHLVEGIASNCFVYLDAQWVTPDLACSGIQGIMRQEILSRLQDYQIDHQIRMIRHEEIAQISAGFFCNALHPMQIICRLQVQQHSRLLDAAVCVQLFNRLKLSELV